MLSTRLSPVARLPSLGHLSSTFVRFSKVNTAAQAAARCKTLPGLTREPRTTVAEPRIDNITREARSVEVQWRGSSGSRERFHVRWLRENCQCSECVFPSSGQRSTALYEVEAAGTLGATITHTDDKKGQTGIHIAWSDGHVSQFSAGWLAAHGYSERRRRRRRESEEPVLWSAGDFVYPGDGGKKKQAGGAALQSPLPEVDYAAYSTTEAGLFKALQALSDYGLVFIRNVPTVKNEVEKVATRIAHIRDTLYGRIFEVENVPDAANVAYTSVKLDLHMDLMYYEAPPGLQLLHCLECEAKGGNSIFTDGYRAALSLLREERDSFDVLTRVPVTFHYQRGNQLMRFRRPLITVDGLNEYLGLIWAPPFQGPITEFPGSPQPSDAEIDSFYDAYAALASRINDPLHMLETRLDRGDCVIFNNRRVLHGRREFDVKSGKRHLQGTYLDMDDFRSRHRVLAAKLAA